LALTPQNQEVFFREVDEELRREQLTGWWRRYGVLMILAVVLLLAALGGYLWWDSERAKARDAASEQFSTALDSVAAGNAAAATKTFDEMAAGDNAGYRALSQLALAGQKLDAGDAAGAAKAYDAIAADQKVSQPVRDLALLRGTAAAFDQLKPEQVIERLKPLAVAGEPWFGSAAEMTAAAWIKLNQPAKAAPLLAALAKDKQVPESIRARAERLASSLGASPAADVAPEKE